MNDVGAACIAGPLRELAGTTRRRENPPARAVTRAGDQQLGVRLEGDVVDVREPANRDLRAESSTEPNGARSGPDTTTGARFPRSPADE